MRKQTTNERRNNERKIKTIKRNIVVSLYGAVGVAVFGGAYLYIAALEETMKNTNMSAMTLPMVLIMIGYLIGGYMILDYTRYQKRRAARRARRLAK